VVFVVKSRKSLFHGELVRKVAAYILIVLLGVALLAPTSAYAHANSAQRKAQKNSKKSWEKYMKEQKKSKQSQKKEMENWNKQHQTSHR
jgi:multisubunit Na+/H+ antiporter MnhG subunit